MCNTKNILRIEIHKDIQNIFKIHTYISKYSTYKIINKIFNKSDANCKLPKMSLLAVVHHTKSSE